MSADIATLDAFRLDGRVAIVTGSSSGLGVAIAQGLAEAGADVALAARRADRLEQTKARVEATGRRVIALPTDIARVEDCQALVQRTVDELGGVDILVNNAGTVTITPAIEDTPEDFRRVIEVNLLGSFWMAQACARVMKPGSSIINISSVIGLQAAPPPQASYAASKAGLLGLTRALASQWTGPLGIRVNAIAPGGFMTEMTADADPAVLASLVPRQLVEGRLGHMPELASACVYLAGDGASYITGQTLVVDGGLTIT